jgi:hypothetical protein
MKGNDMPTRPRAWISTQAHERLHRELGTLRPVWPQAPAPWACFPADSTLHGGPQRSPSASPATSPGAT